MNQIEFDGTLEELCDQIWEAAERGADASTDEYSAGSGVAKLLSAEYAALIASESRWKSLAEANAHLCKAIEYRADLALRLLTGDPTQGTQALVRDIRNLVAEVGLYQDVANRILGSNEPDAIHAYIVNFAQSVIDIAVGACRRSSDPAKEDPAREKLERDAAHWQALVSQARTSAVALSYGQMNAVDMNTSMYLPSTYWECSVGGIYSRRPDTPEAALAAALRQQQEHAKRDRYGLPIPGTSV